MTKEKDTTQNLLQLSQLAAVLNQKKIPLVVQVQEYLKQIGEYRYNTRSHKVEVKMQDATLAKEFGVRNNEWAEITDRIGNSLWKDMKTIGIEVSKDTLYNLLLSTFSPQFDPVEDYLNSLKPWDGVTDHLKEATDRIVLVDESEENRRYLEMCFKKWMVRMVKSWIKDDEFNDCILFLIGDQHAYKTTFIKYLLPPELRPYLKEHFNLEMMNKDNRIELSENLLINIDDLSRIDKSVNGALKNLTSISNVKERSAYRRISEKYPKIASFAATSNVQHILSDETGTRRWLTFHVKKINPSPHPEKGKAFYYEGIYSQIMALIEQNFDYEFSENEIMEINKQNRKFMAVNVAEELIAQHYMLPEDESLVIRETATGIYKNVTGNKHIPGLTVEEIGRALKRMGFESAYTHGVKKYKLQCRMTQYPPTDE